jgi:hypothetical protein
MATEELIVLLDARTAKLDAKLNSTNEKLDRLTDSTKKTDGSFKKFATSANNLGNKVGGLAVAAFALSGVITGIALASATGRRELELMAKQAKTTTSEFQALSFATNKYGINGEQIADISKDIADKVGEFSAAGTGAFQDYADVMKLTKDQARETAQEFEGLSSQEILGNMISQMEAAGVSGDKMTFVLESLGNDASRLIPLFANNSEELTELKKRFDDVNKSLQITGPQAEALADLSTSFTLMTASMSNATTVISATLAPALDDFFNDVIDIVPDATQVLVDFINSLLSAEDIKTERGFLKEISDAQINILEAQEGLRQAEQDAAKFTSGLINTAAVRAESFKAIIKDEQTRTAELNEQLEILKEQQPLLDAAHRVEGGRIQVDPVVIPLQPEGLGDEIQAIEDRFKLEETLLAEKLARELEMIGDNKRLIRDLEDEFADNVLALEKKREKERDKDIKKDKDEEKGRYEFKLDQASGFVSAAAILNSTLLGDNDIIAAGLIVADTATAVMKSLSINPYDYANVAVLIATGIAQLSQIGSSTPSSAGASGGSGSSDSQQQQQRDFQPETTSLEFSNATESGAATFNLTVPDGDEIGQAFANWLMKAQKEGRIK